MTTASPQSSANPADTWAVRAKASVAGGAAAAFVAPLLFLATTLATPASERGFWRDPSDFLFAVPAIWLFAGLVAVPASLLGGFMLLALAGRVSRATVATASALGAGLGALLMNALPLLLGTPSPMGLALSVFAAATGAVGAGTAAVAWVWLRRSVGTNAA